MGKKKEIKRIDLWRTAYAGVVDDLYHKPFVWGENDCAVGLVGKTILALTGVDVVSEYKGQYDTPQAGYKLLKKLGHDNLADMVATILPECHVSEATIGDIAAFATDDALGYALGIVNGERILALTEKGIGSVDLFKGERFFKVG